MEPGAGSAVLKLGLRTTAFPCTGLILRRSIALRTPLVRSVVRTRLIFVIGVSSFLKQDGTKKDSNATPPRRVIRLINSRRSSFCVKLNNGFIYYGKTSIKMLSIFQRYLILFCTLAHDGVIRKLSSILSIIPVNLDIGTENVCTFSGIKGRAETSNMPITPLGRSEFFSI